MMTEPLIPTEPTALQARILKYRNHCNIFSSGARGTAKSTALCFDILAHVLDYGPLASVLVLRESWSGLQEIQQKLFMMARIAFGPSVSQNKAEGSLTFPNGARCDFSNVSDADSYAKHLGKSRSMLAADDFGNFPPGAVQYVNMLRSNLRVPGGKRTHIHMTANPHGRNHTHCLKNFVNQAPAWTPYREEGDGEWWIHAHSILGQNPHLDTEQYRRQLIAATKGNPALRAAWIDGDWNVQGAGLMFEMFDPTQHLGECPRTRVRYAVGIDFGTASPSVGILFAELQEYAAGHIPGDVFAVDMWDTCLTPEDYATGDGSPPVVLAEYTKELLDRNRAKRNTPVTVDDARGLMNDTVVGIFNESGLRAEKAKGKSRAGGWALMRQYLQGALDRDAGKGLWISPKCQHLIDTMQVAQRDDLRPDDISRHFKEDHALDAGVIGLKSLVQRPKTGSGRTIGMW